MIDVVFLACNRLEFTKATYAALKANTDWSKARLVVYDDGSTDGTAEWLESQGEVRRTSLGSPVAVMQHYLDSGPSAPYWAKIDNDTVVPPGWLDDCVRVMDASPELELLGIEAMCEVAAVAERTYRPSPFIGGIGLFRTAAWKDRPPLVADGFFGFTSWQDQNGVATGWIDPSLPVFLLNRLPVEPWSSLSDKYVARGWQRDFGKYHPGQSPMWDWWLK